MTRALLMVLVLLTPGCQYLGGITIGLNYGSGDKTVGVSIKLPEYKSGKGVVPTGKQSVGLMPTP